MGLSVATHQNGVVILELYLYAEGDDARRYYKYEH